MIEKESDEQPVFKVMDKRKFNLDGSLREGVQIEPEKPKTTESAPPPSPAAQESQPKQRAEQFEPAGTATAAEENEEAFDEEIPGADDPASFVNFLTTLASQAAAALGAVPHPVTGQRQLDLESGKYWIDVLAMLRDKTKGNLHAQEARLFDGLLSDLRMQYVQISRLAEEQLKQRAAQKFSANDILGKK